MSGVNYIAMILPQIVTLGVTGAIVTKWGYYVRFSIFPAIPNTLHARPAHY